MFQTAQLQKCWIDCSEIFKSYYQGIVDFNFNSAVQSADKLNKFINDYESSNCNNYPDEFYNDCFIFKELANLLSSYSEYWSQVCTGAYDQSWDALQDVLDLLRTIKKFTIFDKTFLFKFLEKQALGLERLYPYKLFASTEIIVSKVECGICGNNIDSMECDHIQGELYRGKLAYGIVREIKDCIAVALVENPANKRCKMGNIDGKPIIFPCLNYLTESLLTKKVNPLFISHTEETVRRIQIKDSRIGRNEICSCGSGKKFKKCCINKDFAEKKHIEIILKKNNVLTPLDIINFT